MDVLKLIDSYTGDGNFKQTINKDVAKLRLDVRAQGKTLSEVVSAGMFLPGVVAWLTLSRSEKSAASAPARIEAAEPMPMPAKKQGLGGGKK
jgi:hypothetical protein